MNVLYITTVFEKPETTSTIYADLMRALQKNGHKVTVFAGASENTHRTQDGFSVFLVKIPSYYNVSLLKKGLSSLFLSRYFIKAMGAHPKLCPDVILFETPPPTIWRAIAFAKRKFHAPCYLMLKDIAPQNGVDLGLYKKNGLVYRILSHAEKKLYQTADFIGCMSPANLSCAAAHGADPARLELFENTMEVGEPKPKGTIKTREHFRLPKEAVVCVFGGNMGKPQAIPFLMDAIAALKDDPRLYFVLVGRGTERQQAQKFKEKHGLYNVSVWEALPQKEYDALLSVSDIGLVVLDPRFTVPNYPSRILKYMQFSLPVVAATDAATDLGDMIRAQHIGFCTSSNDPRAFVDKLTYLCEHPEERKIMGENAYRYVSEELSVEKSVSMLEGMFDAKKRADGLAALLTASLFDTPYTGKLSRYGWQILYSSVCRHKTEALTYPAAVTASPSMPYELADRWRVAMQKNAIIRHNVMPALTTVLSTLHKNKIPVVALKGLAVLHDYPDPTLRYMGDADLLIPPEKAEETAFILTQNGYRLASCDSREMLWRKGAVDLDIHLAPSVTIGGKNAFSPIKDLFDPAVCVWDPRQNVYMPQPSATLLYMLMHAAGNFVTKGLGLKYIADMALLLQKETLDYDMIFEKASQMGLLDFAVSLFHLCQTKLGVTAAILFPYEPDKTLTEDIYLDCFAAWAGLPRDFVLFHAGAQLTQEDGRKEKASFLSRLFSLRPEDRARAKKNIGLIVWYWGKHILEAIKQRRHLRIKRKAVAEKAAQRRRLIKALHL